jgi:hypothetical protein
MTLNAELRASVRSTNFAVFGVPAVVTVPGGEPVPTLVIWTTPEQAPVPNDGDLRKVEPRRVMAIRRDEVPAVPRGTLIAVSEPLRSTPDLWAVDSMDSVFPDHQRVSVVPHELTT